MEDPFGDFESSLKLSKISLELSGIEIRETGNGNGVASFLKSWLFYINLIWLYTDVVAEVYWLLDGVQMGRTFDELFVNVPCAIICILATAKVCPLYSNKNIIEHVVFKLGKIHPVVNGALDDANLETDSRGRIVEESVKYLNRVVMFLCYTSAVVVVAFTMSPVVSMLDSYLKTGSTDSKVPFHTKYFFDPYTPVRWPFVYAHQVWSTLIACMNVFGADTLLYAFCTYLHMHFRLLRYQFEDVVSESSAAVTRTNFGNAVKRHRELIE